MTVLLFIESRDWETVKMWSQETVHRNWINLAAGENVLNSHLMLNYSDLLLIYLFLFIHSFIYLFVILSHDKDASTLNCICLRHETVQLFSMPCDWETVKNVVP